MMKWNMIKKNNLCTRSTTLIYYFNEETKMPCLPTLFQLVQWESRWITHLGCAWWSCILLRWWRRRRRRRWWWRRHVRPSSEHLSHPICNSNRRIGFEFTTEGHVSSHSFFHAEWIFAFANLVSYCFRAQPTKPFPVELGLHLCDVVLRAILF